MNNDLLWSVRLRVFGEKKSSAEPSIIWLTSCTRLSKGAARQIAKLFWLNRGTFINLEGCYGWVPIIDYLSKLGGLDLQLV